MPPAAAPADRSLAAPAARRGRAVAGLLLAAGLTVSGCTSAGSDSGKEPSDPPGGIGVEGLSKAATEARAKMLTLTTFDSCETLLDDFRKAALSRADVTTREAAGAGAIPPGAAAAPNAAPGANSAEDASKAVAPQAPADQSAQSPAFSGTNVQEQGVDEPDLVKTDGKRVYTVADGKLHIVDAATHKETGRLDLGDAGSATDMLLSGNRALLVIPGGVYAYGAGPGSARTTQSYAPAGTSTLALVDLSGTPKLLGKLTVDGSYLDARQVGSTARVVVKSTPRGPRTDDSGGGTYKSRYENALAKTTIDDWLPGYTLAKSDGSTASGRLVDCTGVSRPATAPGSYGHTGASTTSVLSFDLNGDLGTGSPVTVAADAETVYASSDNLYIAARYNPQYPEYRANTKMPSGAVYAPRTAIYQFAISGNGTPRQTGAGDVDGQLLNQYSLSEYQGHLRVATTGAGSTRGTPGTSSDNRSTAVPGSGPGSAASRPTSSVVGKPQLSPVAAPAESAVDVLDAKNANLPVVGRVGGLGKGEKIYAVRFTGAVGFVVTFRQTDPLYSLDLSNPAAPKVMGELKINGYSAYLHPIADGKLIGVGQDATDSGRKLGTQVSLFDVANLTDPRRIANYALQYASSEAEMDPHAFLYWPQTGTLVIPMNTTYVMPGMPSTSPNSGGTAGSPTFAPTSGPAALVLKLQNGSFTPVGRIEHPGGLQVRRSLVIGDELWTVSGGGFKVNALADLGERAWIPFA
ncbi:hypothetical protein GCM10023205_43230 [Yinghuangia aomiensis]|uniref:Beta propeller domain-containing protein n=1 Tax=Yinghuangia aomiensis TaxID=676205 RepID=A0ABP9HK41_9ACTN